MTTDTEQLQSLDDVLSGKEPAAPVDTQQADDKQVDTGSQTDDAKAAEAAKAGDDKAKADAEAANAQTTGAKKGEQEPKEEWTKKAALDERQKRQKAEARAAELEAELNKLKQPGSKPDFFADPDKALKDVGEQLEQKFQRQLYEQRLEVSQELMREKYPDYDELESEFVEMANNNPVLIREIAQASNPARYAYETAMKAREAASLKDVDKVRAELEQRLRAEIEEKVRREIEEKAKKDGEKRDAAGAPSLAAARSKGSINDQPDDSLDNILSNRKKR